MMDAQLQARWPAPRMPGQKASVFLLFQTETSSCDTAGEFIRDFSLGAYHHRSSLSFQQSISINYCDRNGIPRKFCSFVSHYPLKAVK
jgi:hypothetical protein